MEEREWEGESLGEGLDVLDRVGEEDTEGVKSRGVMEGEEEVVELPPPPPPLPPPEEAEGLGDLEALGLRVSPPPTPPAAAAPPVADTLGENFAGEAEGVVVGLVCGLVGEGEEEKDGMGGVGVEVG